MMREFEQFDVSEWSDGAVIIAAPARPVRKQTRRRRSPWSAVFVLASAMVTGAVCNESLRVAVAETGVVISTTERSFSPSQEAIAASEDDAPPAFWAEVQAYIRSVPPAEPEADMVDPEPFV